MKTFVRGLVLGSTLLLTGCFGGNSGDVRYVALNEYDEMITSDQETYIEHKMLLDPGVESYSVVSYAIRELDSDDDKATYIYDESGEYVLSYTLYKSDELFDSYRELMDVYIDEYAFDVVEQDDTVLIAGTFSNETLEGIGIISDDDPQTYTFMDDMLLINDDREFLVQDVSD